MRCALIMTVKNEADSLPRLFETLSQQSVSPDEMIVTDGGSSDNTVELLRGATLKFPTRVLVVPNANISQGRNAAIATTDADVIASMDAGVRLDPHWLENLTRPFSTADAPDVVSGFFLPDPHGAFETALAATTLPARKEIDPATFNPSSRSVAYRRDAWAKVGGYPEWLDYGEDLVFDFALKAAGCRFHFAPEALVYFRPRPTLGKFFKQYYLYARGDGKADLWLKRHLIRYATYFFLVPLSFALYPSLPLVAMLMWIVAFYALFNDGYNRLAGLWRNLSPGAKLRALVWVPVIRVTGDVAKMIGYPVGVRWRLEHRAIQRNRA
jgi:glycosyltransferase involved in cell wall biosynthesis